MLIGCGMVSSPFFDLFTEKTLRLFKGQKIGTVAVFESPTLKTSERYALEEADRLGALFGVSLSPTEAKTVLAPTTEPCGQRTCYIADPEGNLIEIGSWDRPYEEKDR